MRNIFRHLKLEIALAIPALNERKIETNNSPAQVKIHTCYLNELTKSKFLHDCFPLNDSLSLI